MKYDDFSNTVVIPASATGAAKIARQIVDVAIKDIHPDDIEAAVDRAIGRFAQQLKLHARQELKYHGIKAIRP